MFFLAGLTILNQLLSPLIPTDPSYTCTKFKNAPSDVSVPNFEQILSYLESQETNPDDVNNVALTEEEDIHDVAVFYNASLSEDVSLPLTELIQKYGYDVKEYTVVTEDGYILNVLRIPGEGRPIYLQHGIFTNAGDWITAGPENSLACFLSSQGYDVWLGNTRGSKYSNYHVNYGTECAEFWDFSFDDIGLIDIPAIIDFILEVTGNEKLVYMAHSQGGTAAYVMLSERPEYNDKLDLFVDFSPVAWMSHLKSPAIRFFALNTGVYYKLLNLFGTHEISLDNPIIVTLLRKVCGNTRFSDIICSNAMFLLVGYDHAETNVTQLPVIMNNFYATCSSKQLAHFAQMILSANFRKFDYGKSKNLDTYGSEEPPDYDVSKVTANVVLIYAGNDWFSNVTDVHILMDSLPNVVDTYYIEEFNHLAHIQSKNLKHIIHPYVANLLDKY